MIQRLLVTHKRVYSLNGKKLCRVTRSQSIRQLTTNTTTPAASSSNSKPVLPGTIQKKKRPIIRRLMLYTSVLVLGVYGVGTYAALSSEQFHDLFVEFVPFGERIVDTAEQYGWEGYPVEPQAVKKAGKAAVENLERAANAPTSATQSMIEKAKTKALDTVEGGLDRLKSTSETLKAPPKHDPPNAQNVTSDVASDVVQTSTILSDDVAELVRKVEHVLKGKEAPTSLRASQDPVGEHIVTSDKSMYTAQLPIGFEPPPGFLVPPEAQNEPEPSSHPLPEGPQGLSALSLVAPAVSAFSSSEPLLSHLAITIDNLAAFLKDNPSAVQNSNANEVLEEAQRDLVQLGGRLQHIKEEERMKLEDKLDEQARDYSVALLQLEMDAQDKLDQQEQDWQKYYDQQRQQVIHDYRSKLEAELRTQTELINERLKEEVIAQGIELQRRWIREIKVRVEQERGGRLARLDELAADLKRLSRVTLDNSAYLDENLRLHKLWASIRALNTVVQDSSVRKPFREELRTLRHVAIVDGTREDPVFAVALETLENSDTPDIGVEPFADLVSWFTTGVAPRVSAVALVPDQNAGLLSHVASSLLSHLRFQRRGFVQGDDVLSVIARAEYYLNEKDLDSAARELNQLKGPAKVLLSDWMGAVRKRLEVLQAMQVIQSQATFSSLLVV